MSIYILEFNYRFIKNRSKRSKKNYTLSDLIISHPSGLKAMWELANFNGTWNFSRVAIRKVDEAKKIIFRQNQQ